MLFLYLYYKKVVPRAISRNYEKIPRSIAKGKIYWLVQLSSHTWRKTSRRLPSPC